MCPHCGAEVPEGPLTPYHDYPKPFRQVCPGSKQHPRSVYDRRTLWNGERPPLPPGSGEGSGRMWEHEG